MLRTGPPTKAVGQPGRRAHCQTADSQRPRHWSGRSVWVLGPRDCRTSLAKPMVEALRTEHPEHSRERTSVERPTLRRFAEPLGEPPGKPLALLAGLPAGPLGRQFAGPLALLAGLPGGQLVGPLAPLAGLPTEPFGL